MSDSSQEASENRLPLLWLQTSVFAITGLIAVIGVPWYALAVGFSASAWIAFAVFTIATGLSVTAGYHRLWAHNAYKAHPVWRVVLALLGAATVQNSILSWCTGHRRHHQHVDDNDRDPYSASRGLWFSHIGWMLRDYPSGAEDFGNVRDLERDPIVVWQHRHYLPLVLIMNFAPPLVVGVITGEIVANLLLMGVARLVVTHHTTFFINSLAHYWGRRPYTEGNSARDNGLLAMVTYGEGYHNYHHKFQTDYRNGVRWWQFDPTKWLIWLGSRVGLTSDLRRVPEMRIREAELEMQFKRTESKIEVAAPSVAEHYRAVLEEEYKEFAENLKEWRALREQQLSRQRDKLAVARDELHATLNAQMRDLESALRRQLRRLQALAAQAASGAVATSA